MIRIQGYIDLDISAYTFNANIKISMDSDLKCYLRCERVNINCRGS